MNLRVPPGQVLREYQEAGVQWMGTRDACILADDMGLGKTIQCITLANSTNALSVLVICPSVLKYNWYKEFLIWGLQPSDPCIANKNFIDPNADVIIVNYELCKRHYNTLRNRLWDLIIIDEAHYLKNPESQRVQDILSTRDGVKCVRLVLCTGTPMMSRPIELYPLLKLVGAPAAEDFDDYAKTYCGSYEQKGKYSAWNYKGAKNLDQLKKKIRPYYIRRMKKEVLTELPEKQRQVICIADEDQFIRDAGLETAIGLKMPDEYILDRIAEYRQLTALTKIPEVVRLIKIQEKRRIIYCWHKKVAKAYMEDFGRQNIDAIMISGDTPDKKKDALLERFREEKGLTLVATIASCGVGLNLQFCSEAIFAELPWTPAEVDQAEDRLYRYGQLEKVLIQYITRDNSIDAFMTSVLLRKYKIRDMVIDRGDWANALKYYYREQNQ